MRLSSVSLLIGLLFSTAIISCNKEDTTETEGLPQLDLSKVAYGSDTAQNIDVYLPANRDTAHTKVVLFIHGGSWSGGDKIDFTDAITAIRAQLPDYAVFNMNYRLAANGKNRFPAQIEDIQAALDFIESNAGEYKINTDKVALVGASAGAHLALLQAYKYNSSGKIKAVIDLFGPTDLTDLYNNHPIPEASHQVLVNFLGATPATNPSVYEQASPINFINAQSVPTRIFHGTVDIVAPISQSRALKAKLEANNVKVEMTEYADEGHGWLGNNLADTYAKSVLFIKENVR